MADETNTHKKKKIGYASRELYTLFSTFTSFSGGAFLLFFSFICALPFFFSFLSPFFLISFAFSCARLLYLLKNKTKTLFEEKNKQTFDIYSWRLFADRSENTYSCSFCLLVCFSPCALSPSCIDCFLNASCSAKGIFTILDLFAFSVSYLVARFPFFLRVISLFSECQSPLLLPHFTCGTFCLSSYLSLSLI